MKYKKIPKIDKDRLLSRIIINDKTGCWECTLKRKISKGVKTYCTIQIGKKEYLAHRVSYNTFKDDLSTDLVVDHICRNKICINPDHLRQVTSKINSLENSISIFATNKLKSHCKNGHEFSAENTIIEKGSMGRDGITRRCRSCENRSQRERYEKRKQIRQNNRA